MSKKFDSKEANVRALEFFPQWMDIRKRSNKSMGGIYLSALTEENTDIEAAYEEFKSGFFLKSFAGREDEVLSVVYIAQVGNLNDLPEVKGLTVTTDAHKFLADSVHTILYQDDYLILTPAQVSPENLVLEYSHRGFEHKVNLIKTVLWNVFDEFALFCGLTRYKEETNSQLANRIYAVFKRPTSATEDGIKNAIINAVMNYDNLAPEDIALEAPNQNNMFLKDQDGEVIYEKLSALNKDVAGQKIWNNSYWENSFKKMKYIPNEWDVKLPVYQKGVGQRNDLQVKLSDSSEESTTDLSVMAYKTSPVLINEYIKKQGVSRDIQLGLAKYRDELVERNVEYRIVASRAELLNPDKIFINSKQHLDGQIKCYLDDVMIDPGALTEEVRGQIDTDTPYTLEFTAPSKYASMKIEKCEVIHNDDTVDNLLTENGAFRFVGDSLQNVDVKAHIASVRQVEQTTNLTDSPQGGITIGVGGTTGSLVMDVSHMQGMPVVTNIKCEQSNYTNNDNFVKTTGSFKLDGVSEITSTQKDSDSSIEIEMDCASIQYELVAAETPSEQGTVSISFEIDGEIDASKSGLCTRPRVFSYDFQNNRHVKIIITKMGINPVTIRNIMAARYSINWTIDHGELIQTAQYIKLPTIVKNKLRMQIESLSPHPPVIEYIHVGPALTKALYQIKDFSIKKAGRLNILTDCRVRLLKGSEVVSDNYSTKTLYRNDTKHNATAIIDTSSFLNIKESSKDIEGIAYHGVNRGAITLMPGEALESVNIFGEILINKARQSLVSLLGLGKDEKLYIAGNAQHFIGLNDAGETRLLKIERTSLPADATQFKMEGVPSGTQGVFVLDSSKKVENETNELTEGTFEYAYIRTADTKEYVAYNDVTMLQSPVDNIDIVNTFSPAVNLNTLLFYRIADVHTAETTAVASFSRWVNGKQELSDWALGANHNGIHVEYDFAFGNTEAYKIDLDSFSKAFTLANSIKLEKTYEKNGIQFELARYIITPPDDMRITYKLETVQEDLTITEDGFNKLWYANVRRIISISIDNEQVPEENYQLISDAGIVIWRNLKDQVGNTISIVYDFARPSFIEFKDLSSLYELVGYSIDAYEPMTEKPITIGGLHDGDTYDISVGGRTPDRVIVRCTNENFHAIIDKAHVTVQKFNNAVTTMVHSGYYYDEDKEYYLFENDHVENVNQMSSVELDNIQKNSGSLVGMQGAGNYLKDTAMNNGSHLEKLCYIDCHDHQDRIEGVSDLKAITACDSYQQWSDFNMDVSLIDGHNGLGIRFHSTNVGAYALLNISTSVEEGSLLSFYADMSLKVYIMREIFAGDDPMRKSTYCEKIGECEQDGKFRTYRFHDVDDRRLYLCVTGDGLMDDIIIRKGEEDRDAHVKSIDRIGFDIQEAMPKAIQFPISFNTEGNAYDGLEINNAGLICTGSTVDWGVTRIIDFTENFDRFICYKADCRKNAFYTSGERGTVQSPWVYVSDAASADMLYIKINDVLIEGLQNFDVHIKTADDASGRNSREISYVKKSNLVALSAGALSSYIQIVVEMPPVRVINSIEIYARYVEREDQVLHVTENNEGSMTSKVYDLVTQASYKLGRIDASSVAHPENIRVMIRALRQDTTHMVWTDWYECNLDEELNCLDAHVFHDYRYFQFKIDISDMDANIKINNFVFEVV